MINDKQKLKRAFTLAVESDIQWEGSVTNIDYYRLMCKAATNDMLFSLHNNNLCVFKCNYKDSDSVLMLIAIPINVDKKQKHITERIMDIIQLLEETFVTLDYLSSDELKEEKFVYITCIKKIN